MQRRTVRTCHFTAANSRHANSGANKLRFLAKLWVPGLQIPIVLLKGLATRGVSSGRDAGGEREFWKTSKRRRCAVNQKEFENEKHFNWDDCASTSEASAAREQKKKVLSQLGRSRFEAVGNVKRSMCIYYSQEESAEPTRRCRAEWAGGLSG